jgi:predicted MFS family arabinose efflux permease
MTGAGDATLVVGLLQQLAATLSVSQAAAGQAVTVYAAGYGLGVPAHQPYRDPCRRAHEYEPK